MSINEAHHAPANFRYVFGVPGFAVLFTDSVLTNGAYALQSLSLSALVFMRTDSPLLSALIFGAGFVPQAVGAMGLGFLADLIRPRSLIVLGNIVKAVVAGVLATVHLAVGWQIAIVAAAGLLQAVFKAARDALVPTLLKGDAYVLGRGIFSVSSSAAQLVGLGAGAAILIGIGPVSSLWAAAGAYLVSAAVIQGGLADHPPRTSSRPDRRVIRASIRTNLDLLGSRAVRHQLFVQCVPVSLFVGAEGLVVPYVGELDQPGRAGLVLAVIPVAIVVSNLVIGRWCGPVTQRRLVLPLLIVLGTPLIGFATGPTVLVSTVLLGVAAVGLAYALGTQQDFLDAAPESTRGSLFVLRSAGLSTGQGLGAIAGGVLATAVGTGRAMALIGGALLAVSLIGAPPSGVIAGPHPAQSNGDRPRWG